jgi:flagellar protein FlbD
MIRLTRFNGHEVWLNPDLVLSVESTPDTVLTLTTGEKILLRETPVQVAERFLALKRQIYQPG